MSADTLRLLGSRGARGFADGLVSVLLASYLSRLGFSPLQIGAIVTATLLGSAALTLAVGLLAHRVPGRTILTAASVLMIATGLAFASVTAPRGVTAAQGTSLPGSVVDRSERPCASVRMLQSMEPGAM